MRTWGQSDVAAVPPAVVVALCHYAVLSGLIGEPNPHVYTSPPMSRRFNRRTWLPHQHAHRPIRTPIEAAGGRTLAPRACRRGDSRDAPSGKRDAATRSRPQGRRQHRPQGSTWPPVHPARRIASRVAMAAPESESSLCASGGRLPSTPVKANRMSLTKSASCAGRSSRNDRLDNAVVSPFCLRDSRTSLSRNWNPLRHYPRRAGRRHAGRARARYLPDGRVTPPIKSLLGD